MEKGRVISLIDLIPRVKDLIAQHHVPGVSIAVVQNDQISSAGFGSASIEPPVPCTAETLFDIASCAKSMTAASVALLVGDNERYPDITYDAIMSNLLPEDFVMSSSELTEGVMVEDLLSHRTGMAAHDNSYFGVRAEHPDNARSITRNLRNLTAAAPVRSRYLYCNMMYTVLTHLIAEKTEKSFADFLEEEIFMPLDMTSSNLQPANAKKKGLGSRIATGYMWDKASGYRECQCADCPEGQGAGSIVSSANDFIKWVKALMNQEGPVTPKVYNGLLKQRSFPNHHPARLRPFTSPPIYAAGMEIYYYRGHMVVGHDGNVPGFGARFAFIPDIKFGTVVLGNSSEAGIVAGMLIRELIDDALGVPEAERAGRAKNRRPNTDVPIRTERKGKQKSKVAQNPKLNQGGDRKHNAHRPSDHRSQPADPPEPQTKPLDQYTGRYWNAGYRGMNVRIVNDQLFINASDRAMGFTLTFHHLSNQTQYVAYLVDSIEGGNDRIEAEFVFKDDQVVAMGLCLEQSLKDLIWFEKMNSATETEGR
ncbi:unnamed protein product [Penicillium salamii]|nr:unnamed protein product [Penicillium salamii]CAG8430109.1 unnamed protein product [Penicillium salamii]